MGGWIKPQIGFSCVFLLHFVAFIDFEKAFDWIDRDLLLYKLLLCPIDCKFYYAIKSLYNQTLCKCQT